MGEASTPMDEDRRGGLGGEDERSEERREVVEEEVEEGGGNVYCTDSSLLSVISKWVREERREKSRGSDLIFLLCASSSVVS